MKTVKLLKLPRGSNISTQSLIGVHGDPPHSWANYFNISIEDKEYRVLNLWSENYKSYPKSETTFMLIDKFAIAVDKDVPEDWFYNKLCFTGCSRPSRDVAEMFYAELGSDMSEMEQWDDPKSYYARKGQVYKELPDGSSMCIIQGNTDECIKNRQDVIDSAKYVNYMCKHTFKFLD